MFAIAVVLVSAASLLAADIAVDVEGVRNDRGQVLISLFANAKGFPSDYKQAIQSRIVPAVKGSTAVIFTNVPPGKYAISICHDENKDGKMNTRSLGRPKEGYAFHKQQGPRFGPPKFSKSVFDVATNGLQVAAKMAYPKK